MNALAEIELIDKSEIETLGARVAEMPALKLQAPQLQDEVGLASHKFEEAMARYLLSLVPILIFSCNEQRRLFGELEKAVQRPEHSLALRPSVQNLVSVMEGVAVKIGDGAAVFSAENRLVAEDMAAVCRRMRDVAKAMLDFCDQAAGQLNRAARRAMRKNKFAVGHMPKVPISKPGPKPKR